MLRSIADQSAEIYSSSQSSLKSFCNCYVEISITSCTSRINQTDTRDNFYSQNHGYAWFTAVPCSTAATTGSCSERITRGGSRRWVLLYTTGTDCHRPAPKTLKERCLLRSIYKHWGNVGDSNDESPVVVNTGPVHCPSARSLAAVPSSVHFSQASSRSEKSDDSRFVYGPRHIQRHTVYSISAAVNW